MVVESRSLDVRREFKSEGLILRFGMFLLVICMVLPLVGQAFPYGVPIFGPVVFFTFCVVFISRLRMDAPTTINFNISAYGVLLLLVLVTYLYGILRTDYLMDYRSHVIKDFLNGLEALLLCIATVNIPWNTERLEKFGNRVITLLFIVSVILAVAGLYKAFLLYRGVQIPFIANGNPGRPYPWGSSLVDDYDFYSLALLCGMLGAVCRVVASQRFDRKLLYMAGFSIMTVAGFLFRIEAFLGSSAAVDHIRTIFAAEKERRHFICCRVVCICTGNCCYRCSKCYRHDGSGLWIIGRGIGCWVSSTDTIPESGRSWLGQKICFSSVCN